MRGTCPATNQCPTCKGCDQDGCKGQCHGSTFGVHPEHDAELARLLAEEDALTASATARQAEMYARISAELDPTIPEFAMSEFARIEGNHGPMDEDVKRRFFRCFEGSYSAKYVNDTAYWMLNYAQASSHRRKVDDELEAVKLELQRAKVQLAKHALWAEEAELDRMENPYGW